MAMRATARRKEPRRSASLSTMSRCCCALVDCIFASANDACQVDAEWFAQAPEAIALEMPVRLIPGEAMIWQKSFIMEQERYDGADVLHLAHDCSPSLDWQRLLKQFGDYWLCPEPLLSLLQYQVDTRISGYRNRFSTVCADPGGPR